MTYQGATLNLSPWTHEALSFDEMTDLGRRAVDMHCRMTVLKTRKGWTIRVTSWAEDAHHEPVHAVASYHARGHLADNMHAALDRYQREFVFTADELVTIANQSGIEVTRA